MANRLSSKRCALVWTQSARLNLNWPSARSTESRDSASKTSLPSRDREGAVSKRNPMHQFASGWKRNYYGKGDVSVYRLHRDAGHAAISHVGNPVFGANVTILIYGDAFW